jgi:branched-chain amino acid transport system substrate-binding protein
MGMRLHGAQREEARDMFNSRNIGRSVVVALTIMAGSVGAATADVAIGVLTPLSGKGASYGQQQKNAINMFLEKYGDLGKAGKLQLVIYDTRGDNAEAINLTRKLIDSDQVLAIVGPQFSGEAEVAFPLAVRGQTPIITPMAAKAGITAANRPWAFRFALTTEKVYGPLLDTWLKKEGVAKPIKSVVIFVDLKDAVSNFDAKTVFPPLLKERGVTVLDTISFQTGDIDFSAQITRAKALNPDGFIVSGLFSESAHVVAELRKQGLEQPVVGAIGINHPRFISVGGPATEGVFAASDFFSENPKPEVAEWAADYLKRYGDRPSNAAGEIYDTLYLMRECIERTDLTGDVSAARTKLRDCWATMKDFNAPLTGATSMDKNGDGIRIPTVLIVKDGKFVVVQ